MQQPVRISTRLQVPHYFKRLAFDLGDSCINICWHSNPPTSIGDKHQFMTLDLGGHSLP
jgi:hypothetical protein